ncbi:MAG: CorA family divalent cation transporter [Hyphomicrobium sp.]
MNFKYMPELAWTYGYYWALGLIVLSTIIPLLWFKWRGLDVRQVWRPGRAHHP